MNNEYSVRSNANKSLSSEERRYPTGRIRGRGYRLGSRRWNEGISEAHVEGGEGEGGREEGRGGEDERARDVGALTIFLGGGLIRPEMIHRGLRRRPGEARRLDHLDHVHIVARSHFACASPPSGLALTHA